MTASGVPSGLVVVDKPGGMTSHAVVSRVRRAMGTRKVGHAGTLDPMATGVLVLGVERATRLLGHLMLTEKTYDATVRLGRSTSTDDAEGEVVADTPAGGLATAAVLAAFEEQVGDILQVPTAVSAIKVDGKRAYQRVRDGEQVELTARPVTVHELTVHGQRVVGDWLDVDITVRCSSGTYIRAIARDVGSALGVGGHLTALRRTAVGPFTLAQADTDLDRLTPIPLERAARDCFPALDLDADQAQAVRYGRPLPLRIDTLTGVFAPSGEFLALYRPEGGAARPAAVFVG
ncbi:tRNA pseudouridine(55) synthase TruB [Nocardioides sp. L-11A]|uniref:tRNA pseudouridine(55) synthase TruB n=1 Tax=Nocardioides sp. L-11A TaxID=3043848 RepID=UPI00249C4283|nr:tRNA pseudouridine(55) synthase TruB [Nocardioides sp. L-11A]